jgi:signal transduction histidine kinase
VNRPHQAGRRRQPGFFWQGVLIITPALLLAGFGFLSLRQDRLLALQEASREAARLATDLAQHTLPEALFAEPPGFLEVERFRTNSLPPEQDPILVQASSGVRRIVWLTDEEPQLLYPPAVRPAPIPAPLETETLSEIQRDLWLTVTASEITAASASAAITNTERFLAAAPPVRFAALAWYRLGLLRARMGESAPARRCFERVLAEHKEVLAESGYPLKWFAQLRLAAAAEPVALSLCREAVLNPSPLSALLREQAASQSTGSVVRAWGQVWRAHEQARALGREFQAAALAQAMENRVDYYTRWIAWGGAEWLVAVLPAPDPAPSNHWFVALEETQVRRRVRNTLVATPRPEYLGVSVQVAGRPLAFPQNPRSPSLSTLDDGSGLTPLAGGSVALPVLGFRSSKSTFGGRAAAAQPGASGAPVPEAIRVTIGLVAPQKLYARQRVRTLWHMSLIGGSLGASLVGFLAAWRAFRRQCQLAEMKTNFVSAVSHELRAPIASIRLMSEELQDIGLREPVKAAEYHRLVQQECRRLSSLIENVLDFARREQGRTQYAFELADVVALVEDTVKVMQPCSAERGLRLEVSVTGKPAPAEVDARAIQQALINLLDNAIKHSPEGSPVTVGIEFPKSFVAASRQSAADQKCGALTRRRYQEMEMADEGLFRVWVEDRGPGIPAPEHERIFRQFYRLGSELRRQTPGIGLGLAIVKFVAEAHGGRVSLRSAVGQGSRFTLELPLRHRPEAA